MKVPILLFSLGTLLMAFLVFVSTRQQTCDGTWANRQHTIMLATNCHIDW